MISLENIKLVIRAIKELDPSCSLQWITIAYYDLENNWSTTAPSKDAVRNKIVEYMWEPIRKERNKLLSESDWTQSRDIVLNNDEEWKVYRQALRDITEQNVENISWPQKPA
jgi:hypothetical protein